jgi:hypothetical protein
VTGSYLAPEIAAQVEASLPVDEFDRRVAAFTEEEAQEALELIRWFMRRYPTPKERLDFARRTFEQWTRPTRIVPHPLAETTDEGGGGSASSGRARR